MFLSSQEMNQRAAVWLASEKKLPLSWWLAAICHYLSCRDHVSERRCWLKLQLHSRKSETNEPCKNVNSFYFSWTQWQLLNKTGTELCLLCFIPPWSVGGFNLFITFTCIIVWRRRTSPSTRRRFIYFLIIVLQDMPRFMSSRMLRNALVYEYG